MVSVMTVHWYVNICGSTFNNLFFFILEKDCDNHGDFVCSRQKTVYIGSSKD